MIEVFVKDTETGEVVMDKLFDGLYLVGAEKTSKGHVGVLHQLCGEAEYAKMALHTGIHRVPQQMLDTLEDFNPPKAVYEEEAVDDDDDTFKGLLSFLSEVLKMAGKLAG